MSSTSPSSLKIVESSGNSVNEKSLFVRRGKYKTNDFEAMDAEIIALHAQNNVPETLRLFTAGLLRLVLLTGEREKTRGRFSCPGATQVMEKGDTFLANFSGDALIDPTKELPALFSAISRYAELNRVEAYADEMQKSPNETPLLNTVFIAVIDKQFSSRIEAISYFSKLLKVIGDFDAQSGSSVAQGYSRDPLDPMYIISIGGIPFFVNVLHDHETNDHQSENPGILFVPQAIFEHQKKRMRQGGLSEYDVMSDAVRKNLKNRYGDFSAGLNKNGEKSALANFLFYSTREESDAVAQVMGLDPDKTFTLIERK